MSHTASPLPKAWREYRVQLWRAESFRFSTDPELVGNVTDVVGLYLNPIANDRAVDQTAEAFAGALVADGETILTGRPPVLALN